MEHTVTFEQLGNQFHLEEAQIIYYFDSVLDSELTPKQIKHVFTLNKKRESPYEYYKNHFILFRDLGVLLKKDQKSLEQYNQKQPDKWKKISEIEAKRKSIIQMNRAILIQFAELINELTNDMQNKTTYIDKILDQFSNHIKNPSMMLQLKVQNQPSYFKTLVRSAQFIALYLEQESYSTKNLIEMFQIKSRATERLYLYHPFVFQLLNEEVQQYIKTKREIAHLNGLQKKQEAYLQNKSYQKVARNAHGQFTKK